MDLWLLSSSNFEELLRCRDTVHEFLQQTSASELNYRAAAESPLEGPPDQPLLGRCHGCYNFGMELQTQHPEVSQLLLNSGCGQMKSSCQHPCSGNEG